MATTSAKQGTITKIYDLQTLGFEEVQGQFKSLTKEIERLKKAKQSLDAQRSTTNDVVQAAALEKEIRKVGASYDFAKVKLEALTNERRQHMNVLAAEISDLTLLGSTQQKTTQTSVREYYELNKQYREARDNAASMAKQFGIDSDQARAAAASAAAYKQQLTEINTLIKNGGRAPAAAPAIISTDNLAELRAEQARSAAVNGGSVVNDLERSQAEATNTATAYGTAQLQASAAVEEMTNDLERVKIPLEEYTGTLQANIRQNESYKTRIAQIGAELKLLNTTTDTAGKRTSAYQNKVAALVEEQKMLKIASSEVSQTIGAQVKYVQAADGSHDQLNAKLGLSRNLLRQLSEEEKKSPFGKQLASDITLLDGNMKKMDASMGNYQRNVGNYGSAFGKAFGFIRQAANILPGIGIAGIFGLLFTGLEKLGSYLVSLATKTGGAKEEAERYRQALIDINSEAIKISVADTTKIDILKSILTDVTKSQQARTAALNEYNKMADASNQIDAAQLNNISLINSKMSEQLDLIKQRALARASESIIAQRAESLLLAQEKAGSRVRKEVNVESEASAELSKGYALQPNFSTKGLKPGDVAPVFNKKTNKIERVIVTEEDIAGYSSQAPAIASSRAKARKERTIQQRTENDPDVIAAQQQLDAALAAFRDKYADSFTDEKSKAATTNIVKNFLSDIEANLRRELAVEETRITEIKKSRKLTFDEEVGYAQNIEAINVKYLNQKIAFLTRQKKLSAEERATLANFIKDRADIELKTQKDIEGIKNREYQEQQALLKNDLEDQLRIIRESANAVLDDTYATEVQKTEAKLKANALELAATEAYGAAIVDLQKKYGQQSVRAVKDADEQIAQIKRATGTLQKELIQSIFKDYEKEIDHQASVIKLKYAELRDKILNSGKSKSKQQLLLSNLEKPEARDLASEKLKALTKELGTANTLYYLGLITLEQYEAIYTRVNNAQKELNTTLEATKTKYTSIADFLKQKLSGLFKSIGATAGAGLDQKVGQVISESYDLAQTAMHSFYDAERARIQQNLEIQQQRIDSEKQQVLSRAQSQAEIDSIEKQYAAKKKKAEDEAHQQLKKTKKAETKIALATELANIWSTVWQLGPVAGAIAGVVLSGLALGRYGTRIGEINREQFAYGGQPGEVPTEGGTFGGSSHSQGGTPFMYKGRAFEAEVGELSVIRTKNAPSNQVFSITGNHTQIASKLNELGGGRRFATGAKLTRFEYGGNLGESLQAPTFTPAQQAMIITQGGASSDDMKEMLSEMRAMTEATNKRIDRIEVHQVTHSVTDAQKKQVQQSSIGRL